MIVGVVGPIASGKSVLSDILVSRSFLRMSLSEEVREEARKKSLPIERVFLQNLGNEMRQKYGKGYWAKRLIAKTSEGKNYIIGGIRNLSEVEEFRKLRNFVLIGISALTGNRLKWILARNKDSNPKTLAGISAMVARDRGVGKKALGQQAEACFDMVDDYIENDSTLEELQARAVQLVEELGC